MNHDLKYCAGVFVDIDDLLWERQIPEFTQSVAMLLASDGFQFIPDTS